MNDSEHKILYQLMAKGCRAFLDEIGKIYSKKVFCDKEQAEDYKEEFRKVVTTPACDGDIYYLSDDNLDIRIVELFLIKD